MTITYQCGICAVESPEHKFNFDPDQEFLPERFGWEMITMALGEYDLQIPACEKCKELELPYIFEKYKENVKLGLVPGYH